MSDALTISINLILLNRTVRYITDTGYLGEPQPEQSRRFDCNEAYADPKVIRPQNYLACRRVRCYENLFLRRLRLDCIREGLSRIIFSVTSSGWSL